MTQQRENTTAKRPADDSAADAAREDDSVFAVHADFCQIFSDEKRLRIMWFLGEGERSVSEIASHLGASLQNTSQHLRVMRDKGAVTFRKVGQSVLYRIANPKFLLGIETVRKGLLEELDKQRYLG
jgi:DNA-binding transcriptional ArsR family regulator